MFSKQRNKTEEKMGPHFADKMTEFKINRVQYNINSSPGLLLSLIRKKTSNFQVTYNHK